MIHQDIAIDRQELQECFSTWRAEQGSLDAQLDESLSALRVYQSHLDDWHRELAAQRELLDKERLQCQQDQEVAQSQREQLDQLKNELAAARQKMAQLSAELLAKTEELRNLDQARAELTTKLELSRAREQQLTEMLDQQGRSDEKVPWNDELRLMRELLERQSAWIESHREAGIATVVGPPRTVDTRSDEDPVIGSVVAQFDKLRQQQAESRKRA